MLYPDFNELLNYAARSSRLNLHTRRKVDASRGGDYASPFRGQGLEFHEVREYRPGDDVRNIHWRVTARMERPYLKVFTEERERTVLLCVDAGAAMRFGTRGTFKSVQAARAAAVLGWMAQAAGDKVGALVFGDVPKGQQFFTPVRGRRALWQALKLLSHKSEKPQGKGSFGEALAVASRSAPTGALVFIISDFMQLDDAAEMQLAMLRRRCEIILVRVGDPSDRTLPPMDGVWFSDLRNTKLLASTTSKVGLENYARQYDALREKLDDIAARHRIGAVDLQTNRDVLVDLVRGLRRIDYQKRSHR